VKGAHQICLAISYGNKLRESLTVNRHSGRH